VSAVAAAPNAPQRGDRKTCKLSVFLICFISFLLQCGSSRSMYSPADHRASSSPRLKCAHLVPAKVPLPEEAIFNQKQAATEKRCAARKAQHKKRQIAKRDRNDNRNKRRKAGEVGVSSDEDPSPEPSWSGDVASAAVDWSDMLGSSSSSPPHNTEVSSSHRPAATGRDKTTGSISCQVACPAREGHRAGRSHTIPSGAGASELQRTAPRQVDPPRRSEERPTTARRLYDGSNRPDYDSLQRRRSPGRSSDSASKPSAPPVAESSVAPRRLQSLLIRGGGAPEVHVSLVASRGHSPTPTVAEVGGTALEPMGESVATVEAVGRSEAAPKMTGSQRATPESVGSKHATPQHGMSDRPVKKARVRSKM
jgi:hypothetical protein